jgi:hypothetical protein
MWPWRRKLARDGFPERFKVQRIVSSSAVAISGLPAPEIARYIRANPGTARQLLQECCDKRSTATTFITEIGGGFRVGWITRAAEHECVKEFSDLADAATDYLLFSLGKSRWVPPNSTK